MTNKYAFLTSAKHTNQKNPEDFKRLTLMSNCFLFANQKVSCSEPLVLVQFKVYVPLCQAYNSFPLEKKKSLQVLY